MSHHKKNQNRSSDAPFSLDPKQNSVCKPADSKQNSKQGDCTMGGEMIKISTARFGKLEITPSEVLIFREGILGFAGLNKYCLVDPGDDTLILWLQSIENPNISFPVLEPRVFKKDYLVKLSAVELKELALNNVNQSAVFTILTIPKDVTQMTANLKAPLVINLSDQLGRQVILQENEYSVKHLMFKELKAHLATIRTTSESQANVVKDQAGVVSIKNITPSALVKTL